MSDEQINIAIAEARGWEPLPEGHFHPDNPLGQTMPNYCNDLNAMREAEKMLTEHQWGEYERVLRLVCDGCSYYEGAGKELLHATAAQRAEAFLRTLGKWEEA